MNKTRVSSRDREEAISLSESRAWDDEMAHKCFGWMQLSAKAYPHQPTGTTFAKFIQQFSSEVRKLPLKKK